MTEPTLDELLGHVMRDTGWIMAGGSAQFRQGALSSLQDNLKKVRKHVSTARVVNAVKILGDRAADVARTSSAETDAIMGLRRILEEFET